MRDRIGKRDLSDKDVGIWAAGQCPDAAGLWAAHGGGGIAPWGCDLLVALPARPLIDAMKSPLGPTRVITVLLSFATVPARGPHSILMISRIIFVYIYIYILISGRIQTISLCSGEEAKKIPGRRGGDLPYLAEGMTPIRP
jgi:hypothetical protein